MTAERGGAARGLLEAMTWEEFAAALEREPVVILPTGAVEQHGPHLPLGVDYLLPLAIARDVAADLDALVAPPLCYGYKSMPRSGGGPFFPGTTGLDGATLTATVRDVVRELHRNGVRRICVLDGNFENRWYLTEGLDLAFRELADPGLRLVLMQHWDFLTPATLDEVFPEGFPGIELEHAAVLETSLMMHYYPELVRHDRIPHHPPVPAPPYDTWPPRREWVPESGALVSARGASAAKGAAIARQYRRDMAAALTAEFGR